MGERGQFSPQLKAERVLELLNGTHADGDMPHALRSTHSITTGWKPVG